MMFRKIKTILFFIILLFSISETYSQDKYTALQDTLKKLSDNIPALNEKVTISVTGVSIQEFLRAVAKNSGLNIDVSPELNFTVINNFSDVLVRDILVFICKQYELNFSVIGSIVTVYKEKLPEKFEPERLSIRYNEKTNLFTIDYKDESLVLVAKEITKLTGNNVVLAPGLSDKLVNGYVQNMPFKNALEKFMFTNNLSVRITDDNFYVIEETRQPVKEQPEVRQRTDARGRTNQAENKEEFILDVILLGPDSIRINAVNAPVMEIFNEISGKTKTEYSIAGAIDDRISLKVDGAGIDQIIEYLLNGSNYTFKKTDGIYIIGEQSLQGLKEHKVIQLQNRTIDKLVESLPHNLLKEVEVVEFPELNSLLVSGSPINVKTVEEFVKKLDKIVPVVLIEIMIVDINKKFTLTTGVNAAFGDQPVESKGTVFPNLNVTISSSAINNFLKKRDHFGIENLGNVTPNFYLSLKALEEQGLLTLRSTPQLSTLNGHEATMTIGNTAYYLEEQVNLINTINTVESRSQQYKSLNAELSVTIRPIVSGDDQITLDIEVKQSDFTERISPTAPPGSVSRTFQSQIRVKNQEMILLGGLEEKRMSDTGTGTPFLSRVPVIRWFFSSRSREDSKSKLNVLIKPTIIG